MHPCCLIRPPVPREKRPLVCFSADSAGPETRTHGRGTRATTAPVSLRLAAPAVGAARRDASAAGWCRTREGGRCCHSTPSTIPADDFAHAFDRRGHSRKESRVARPSRERPATRTAG
jgi:hypothetical protein